MRRTTRGTAQRGARGQASTEYIVLLACLAAALLAATLEPAPVAALAAAIQRFFAAYSYAISLTP